MSVSNKQHAVTEFMTAENVPLIDIHQWVKVVYGENCIDIRIVWHGAADDANLSHAILNDEQCSGRPWTATDKVHQNHDEIIKENHCVSQLTTANKTAVSYEWVQVITADLRYQKLCTQCFPWLLTEELKQKQIRHLPTVVAVIWMWRWWILLQNSDWD
jgi:hypothetical protein